jgi:hypothetical protein
MHNKSTKPVYSRTLKLSLAAIAGAAVGMGNDASAAIVTANLNGTATLGNDIYFTYSAGTIGTLISADGIRGSFHGAGKSGVVVCSVESLYAFLGARSEVVGQSSPFALHALISSGTSTWEGGIPVAPGSSGYYGVRFWAGGSDYNYGWVDVTYTPTGLTFGLASVETTINTGILAGAVSSVPETNASASVTLLVAGVFAMVNRRRVVRTGSAVA